MRARRTLCLPTVAGAAWYLGLTATMIASSAVLVAAAPIIQQGPPESRSLVRRGGVVGELERLADGLTLMSESDFPLDVVAWRQPGGRPSATRLGRLTGQAHPETVETMTVDEFFRAAATPRPGDPAEVRAVARRFGRLVHFLKTRLTEVRVFRFGHLTLRSYVVGMTADGDWVGLAMTQIET
jgi:nuclease A inhibitor-like protein